MTIPKMITVQKVVEDSEHADLDFLIYEAQQEEEDEMESANEARRRLERLISDADEEEVDELKEFDKSLSSTTSSGCKTRKTTSSSDRKIKKNVRL